VGALEPLPRDEAVSLALANRTADAIIESYEVTDVIAETLPDGIEFIAVPLTNGIKDLITGITTEIIRSDAFITVWSAALTGVHKIALAYVGALESGVLVEEDGVAVLDLAAIGARITEDLDIRGFNVLEGTDRDLRVELFELPDSGLISFVVDVMYSVRWALFLLTIGLLVAAIGVATDRRRISKWIGGATVFAMVFSLIDMRYARSALTGGVEDPIQKAGAEAAWDIIFRGFVQQTWVVLVLGGIVILVAWIMGDSEGAVTIRSAVGTRGQSAREDGSVSSVAAFIASHRRLIEWGAAGIVVGFLLLGPPQPIGLVVSGLVLLGLIVAVVEYAAASVRDEEPVSQTVA
ncbi:MAG: hypothetical protein ACC658_17755, partial [Acidimicrobiia bacterium]